jgi:hypothetical protein
MWWRRQRAASVIADGQVAAEAAGTKGVALDYLGVEIVGDHVWTRGGPTQGRYLGLLDRARADLELRGLSAYGVAATMSGVGPHVVGTISVTFAHGATYRRALRPGAHVDASKIEAQVARFNALAEAAARNWLWSR